MEHNVDIAEVQRKANALLQDLLDRSTSKSSQEIAHNITGFAFEEGNPVRELFLSAVPTGESSCLQFCMRLLNCVPFAAPAPNSFTCSTSDTHILTALA